MDNLQEKAKKVNELEEIKLCSKCYAGYKDHGFDDTMIKKILSINENVKITIVDEKRECFFWPYN